MRAARTAGSPSTRSGEWSARARRVTIFLLGSALALFPGGITGCRPTFQSMTEIRDLYTLPAVPRAEQYPDADAVVLLATVDTELYATDASLSTDQVVHRIVTVLRNVEASAEVAIELFPGEELVEIEARIHDPAGRILPLTREEIDLGRVRATITPRGGRFVLTPTKETSTAHDVDEGSVRKADGTGDLDTDVIPGDREGGGADPGDFDTDPTVDDLDEDDDALEKNTVRLHFAGLTPGSSYEYRYRLRRHEPYLHDTWAVQEYAPVVYAHYTLTVPKDLYDAEGKAWDWRYRLYRCARIGTPEVVEQVNPALGRVVTYRWTLRDIAAFRPEERMTAPAEHLAFVRFAHASWTSWDAVTGSYWRNHLARVLEPQEEIAKALPGLLTIPSATAATDPALREVAALARYVQDLPAIDLAFGEGSLTPARPAQVLERGRGDVKDKAILLVALLRAAGHTADPALVMTRARGPLDVEFPHWSFDHLLVRFVNGGTTLWIDPTARHYPLGELPWRCEGVDAVIIRGDGTAEIERTPQPGPSANQRLAETRVVVHADGSASGDAELVIDGEPGSLLLGRFDPFRDRRAQVQAWCQAEIRRSYPDAIVLDADLRETSPGRVLVSFRFQTDGFVVTDDVLPHLPEPPFPFDAGLELIGEVERRFPVENGYPATSTRRLSVDLSASPYRIVAAPSQSDVHDREVAYRGRYTLRNDRELLAEETLEIRPTRLLTRVYKMARLVLEAQEEAGTTAVVLGPAE